MTTYFITYPVTPNMGLRESINAMLEHVADNSHPFGYLPSAIHQANYERLLEDYAPVVQTSVTDSLELVSRVEDSALLEHLVDTLVTLCNDYPAYDDERMHQIEQERLIDMLEDQRSEDDPSAEDIATALYDTCAHIEQSEHGAWVSDEDYHSALMIARAVDTKARDAISELLEMA